MASIPLFSEVDAIERRRRQTREARTAGIGYVPRDQQLRAFNEMTQNLRQAEKAMLARGVPETEERKPILREEYERRTARSKESPRIREEAESMAFKQLQENPEYNEAFNEWRRIGGELAKAQDARDGAGVANLQPHYDAAKSRVDEMERAALEDILQRYRESKYDAWLQERLWGAKPSHKRKSVKRMLAKPKPKAEEEEPEPMFDPQGKPYDPSW